MDEDLKRYLDSMMAQINGKLEDILDKLSAARADADNTKGHMIYVMEDSLTLSRRISKLEEQMRRQSKGDDIQDRP
jgi:hypothetical protein